jgi:hypothetical protein
MGGGAGMPRGAPKLHGALRVGFVHVQRRFELHGGGGRVSHDVDIGDVREGRAGVLLRVSIDAVHQRCVQRGSVLHERVHKRSQTVCDGRGGDMRHAIEWVHRMGSRGGLSRDGTDVQRGRKLRNVDGAELRSERGGNNELRSGERELLHEPRSYGRDV